MPNEIVKQIELPDGTLLDIKDNISGYIDTITVNNVDYTADANGEVDLGTLTQVQIVRW